MTRSEVDRKYKGKRREKLLESIYKLESESLLLRIYKQIQDRILAEQKQRLDSTEYEIIRSFEKEYKGESGMLTSCIGCQRLRTKKRNWEDVSQFLKLFTSLSITTSICPHCQEMLKETDELKRQIAALKNNEIGKPSASN